MAKKHKIAVIPGDGIGKEVVPEGLKVLDAVASRFGIDFQWDPVSYTHLDVYKRQPATSATLVISCYERAL